MRDHLPVLTATLLAISSQAAAQDCGSTPTSLTRPGASDYDGLGYSVVLGEHGLAVGAPDASGTGTVEFYTPSEGGWAHAQTLAPGDTNNWVFFGAECDMSGDVLVVSAPFDGDGSVYIFRWDGSAWRHEQKLTQPTYQQFGWDVAVEGRTLLIGAPYHNVETGAVYVYDFDGSLWSETQFIVPDGGGAGGRFGWPVDLAGNVAVAGAIRDGAGAAYVLRYAGTEFVQEAKLTASDGVAGDRLAVGLATDGFRIVAGANLRDEGADNAGAAYIFYWNGAGWEEEHKLLEPDPGDGNLFGNWVSVRDDRVIVGSHDDDAGNSSGSVYMYDGSGGAWTLSSEIYAPSSPESSWFGWRFDDYGDHIAIGARTSDEFGESAGAAYVYNCLADRDTDGDGLLDSWETDGIPFTASDGSERLYVLDVDGDGVSDADPNHKDLFVEVDLMDTLTFPAAAAEAVADAFWAAPVANPDGDEGITLHIVVDHTEIPFEAETPTPGNAWPADASLLKASYFGTDDEQSDTDNLALLDAKRKAYRYCLMYNEASTNIGGLGERPGDDFVIFAGAYTTEQKAAVFMHELGHNLNLRHGGGDGVNMKPNYPSIMNYVHSYRGTWNNTTWRLDYSRERLASINEAALDEPVSLGLGGSGFYAQFLVPYYGELPEDTCLAGEAGTPIVSYALLDPSSGGQDFNLDCDRADTDLAGDLNYLQSSGLPGSGSSSPGELLHGHDDWAKIVLPISDGGGPFAGPAPTDELTTDQLQWMNDNFPRLCNADWNVDGVVNTQDFLAYLNDWASGEGAADLNRDGVVNTIDFIGFLNDWTAGC